MLKPHQILFRRKNPENLTDKQKARLDEVNAVLTSIGVKAFLLEAALFFVFYPFPSWARCRLLFGEVVF